MTEFETDARYYMRTGVYPVWFANGVSDSDQRASELADLLQNRDNLSEEEAYSTSAKIVKAADYYNSMS